MVQAVVPDPVAVVFDVVPLKVPTCVPSAAALLRLVKQFDMSVLTLDSTAITFPATGAVRDVIDVP